MSVVRELDAHGNETSGTPDPAQYGSFAAGIAGTVYSMWCTMHAYGRYSSFAYEGRITPAESSRVYGFGVWVNFLSSSYISNLMIPDSITALLVQVRLLTRAIVVPIMLSEQTFFAERAYRLMGNSKVFLVIAAVLM